MKHVALLRGVNVGGNNTLPMKALAALFTDAGCGNVVTYIQSGNVIFSIKSTAKLADRLCACVEKQFGFRVPIILRSREEMEAVVAGNPYSDDERCYIVFLATSPSSEQTAQLDPMRSPPDEFVVSGKDIYLKLATGAAKTKLTNAYFDSKLKTVSTIRNWRTAQKLLAMMGE